MTESGGRLGHPIDRRTFLAGAAGAAGALYLGACGGGSGTSARALHLAGGDAGFPSPFAYSRGPGYVQMSYIYDTLLWTDASGRQLPWLASRVRRSSDGLTYTFELRDNVRWHDGRPLTPADVASLRLLRQADAVARDHRDAGSRHRRGEGNGPAHRGVPPQGAHRHLPGLRGRRGGPDRAQAHLGVDRSRRHGDRPEGPGGLGSLSAQVLLRRRRLLPLHRQRRLLPREALREADREPSRGRPAHRPEERRDRRGDGARRHPRGAQVLPGRRLLRHPPAAAGRPAARPELEPGQGRRAGRRALPAGVRQGDQPRGTSSSGRSGATARRATPAGSRRGTPGTWTSSSTPSTPPAPTVCSTARGTRRAPTGSAGTRTGSPFAGSIPLFTNKQAFITGAKTG